LDETQRPALLRQIAAYQELYPDVQFDVLYVPSVDLKESFEAAMLEGGGPMILIGPGEWGAELYDQGWIADLSSLASPGLLKRLNPAGLGTGQYRGHLVGLPVSLQGVVLYRNQKMILSDPITFDDLVLQAKAATSGEQIGAILDRSFFFAGGHLMGLGGQLVDENGSPEFNDEKGLAWLRLLGDFGQAGPVDDFTDNDLEIFKQGRAGFIIDGTWNRGVLAEAIGPENLAIDPWPIRDEGRLSGFVQSESIFLRQEGMEGEDLSLPWSFMEFFLSPEAQAGLLEVGLIPATLPEQLPPAESDRLLEEAMQALAGGTAYPTGIDFALYSTALGAAVQSVFDGGVPPAEALNAADVAIRTAQSGQEVTPTP
jgi:ABC-type glycerol-3-phosphate transport system substrate-binding protein